VQNLLKKKDFYAGLAIMLLGAVVNLNSTTYKLGILLTFVGILIFGTGVITPLKDERILPETMEWRGWACILAGPIMFIIFGKLFGMVAATFMCVFVSALGDRSATFKGSALLATGITVAGTLLFSYVLKVPFPPFRWGL
jgi:hypothetical protein